MKCSHCGKEVPENAKVCGYCGVKLAQQAAETPKPVPQKAVREPSAPAGGGQAAEKKKLPKWALPAGLGAAALALVLFFVMQSPSQPETVREEPQQEEAPAVTEMELLAGTWRGDVVNKVDDFTFEITFAFPNNCELNSYCGRVIIPEFNLVSDVMITSVNGYEYEFFVRENEDMPEGDLPYEYLKYINPSQLEFFSESDTWEEQGTLYKQ